MHPCRRSSAPTSTRGLASWLEARRGEQVTGHEELVGYHLEQAYVARAELGRRRTTTRAQSR